MELYNLTARQMVEEVKRKKSSVRDINESCVKRIAELEDSLHVWAYFDKELTLKQIERIEKSEKEAPHNGLLLGVPVGIKDVFNTEDMPTRMGSSTWEGFHPGNDARVVHSIKMEGGIVMGKTVTAEFAVHQLGPTRNPHNINHSPGTSSSGSAVAVATCMVPIALGTQTAGSIIKPASYCGVYGYKPTFGLLPRTGILKTVDSLDHVGFFARDIADLRLALDVMRVRGENYPYVYEYIDSKKNSRKKNGKVWRVAFAKTHIWDYTEDYTKTAIERFARKLSKEKGIEVREVVLPDEFKESHRIHAHIYNKALSYYFKEEVESMPHEISDIFKGMADEGRKISLDEYRGWLERQNELEHLLEVFFKDYDVVIATSTAGEAPEIENFLDEKLDTSLIWTLCRAPSINVPLFKGPKALPFGAQFVSRKYNDYVLVSFLEDLADRGIISVAGVASVNNALEPARSMKY
ncbi:MAG: amidase [Candidatus Omnitrophica bacterium]|nr:amidase [Candidatus Omnitrophota bacterium]